MRILLQILQHRWCTILLLYIHIYIYILLKMMRYRNAPVKVENTCKRSSAITCGNSLRLYVVVDVGWWRKFMSFFHIQLVPMKMFYLMTHCCHIKLKVLTGDLCVCSLSFFKYVYRLFLAITKKKLKWRHKNTLFTNLQRLVLSFCIATGCLF